MTTRLAVVAMLIGAALATPEPAQGPAPQGPAPRVDAPQNVSPQGAADELLAADRGFASRAAGLDVVDALTAMFAADVILPGPPGRLYRGADEAAASLRSNPDNADGHLAWTPVRVGLSADGSHGFTFGFMTQTRQNGTTVPLKYMAYWVKGDAGWRVAGYKRARRPEGNAATTPMAPLLPARLVPARQDAARLEALRQGLRDAERAFSDEAQKVGLGPAFVTWGSPTAVNMGGPTTPSYVVGNTAIGALVGGGRAGASPVEWSSDRVLVASSGDLGISFGHIRPNGPPPAGAPPDGQPFFTIWYRASPTGPWRYIAE